MLDIKNEILNQQVDLLFKQLPFALISSMGFVGLVVWSMKSGMLKTPLLTWATMMICVHGLYFSLYFAYQHYNLKTISSILWFRLLIAGSLLIGAGWAGLTLFHVDHLSAHHEVIVVLALGAVSTVAIATMSARREVMLAFLLPVLVSMLISQLYLKQGFDGQLGMLLFLYCLAILSVALRWHRSIKMMLIAQIENRKYKKDLEQENAVLKIMEERLLRVQTFAEVGTWERDLRTGDINCSEIVGKFFGYTSAIPLMHYDDFVQGIHQDDKKYVTDALQNTLSDGQQYDVEYRYLWSDGSVHWIHSRGNVLRDEQGKSVSMLGAIRDITKRKNTEQALHKETEFLNAVLENVEDGVVACDESGSLTLFNRAARRLHGLPDASISAEQWTESYYLYLADGVTPMAIEKIPLVKALHGEKVVKEEMVVIPEGRELHRLLVSGQGIVGASGEQLGAVVSLNNITQQKSYEEELRKGKAEFEAIFNSISDAVVFTDINRKIVRINPALTSMFGYKLEDIEGTTIQLFYANRDDYDNQGTQHYKFEAKSSDSIYEMRCRHKNGTEFCGETLSTKVNDADGNVIGFVGIIRDITERKKAVKEIENSKRQLLAVLDTIPVSVFWKDNNLNYIGCNRRFSKDAGFDEPRELIGKDDFDMPWKQQAEIYRSDDQLVMASGDSKLNYEETQMTQQNEVNWVSISKIPMRSPEGEIMGVLGVYENINPRKLAEQEQSHLQQQLQQAQKMESIGQLTGGIAHDFNNILAGIIGYTDLSLERFVKDEDSKLYKYLHQVKAAGIRGRDLVAQLLAFSRMTPGKPKPMLIAPAVDEAVNILRSTLPANIELTTESEIDLPAALMDQVHLSQIVMNLCINARDAMKDGGRITVRSSIKEISADQCSSCRSDIEGSYISISVSDSGKGMSPEVLQRIFEPFYSTKDVDKGTGMGLSMVHGIIHEHNGHICVTTEIEKGTEFVILLPIPKEVFTVTDLVIKPTMLFSQEGEKIARALVVDDEESIGLFLIDLLEMYGYEVTFEHHSQSALQRFQNDPLAFDIVITDQTMPGLTGLQLADQVLAERPELPVIICTGYSETVDAEKAKCHGVKGFIEKPIDTEKLLVLMQHLLVSEG